MRKYIIFIGLVSLILPSCNQKLPNVDVPIPILQDVVKQNYSAMSQAISRDATINKIIADDKNLTTLVIVKDPGFNKYLIEKNISESQFLSHTKLHEFLEGHILLKRIEVDGMYTSLSGKKWQVVTKKSTQSSENMQLESINGVDVEYCSLAYTSYNTTKLSQFCVVSLPITSLE